MKKIYDRINDMRGNLITVEAEDVSLGELAVIEKKDGVKTLAQVLQIDKTKVTLQVFGGTRGISTGDHVIFLKRQMEAVYGPALLGRRLNGAGVPIDGGPGIE